MACHAPQQEAWEREASLLELLEADAQGVQLLESGAENEKPWMLPGTLTPRWLELVHEAIYYTLAHLAPAE